MELVRVTRAFCRVGLGRRLAWIETRTGDRKRAQMLGDAELDRCGLDDVSYFEATYDSATGQWTLGAKLADRPF
jgi:hypothetical protein